MDEIYNRLKQIREFKGMSQSEFADFIGIGRSTLGMMEVGKREILDRHIKMICSICNVREDWLRTGAGEMFVRQDDTPLEEYAKQHGADALEISLMKAYFDIDPQIRKALIDRLRSIFSRVSDMEASEEIDGKVESYRRELEAAKKAETSSASQTGDEGA